MDKYEKQYIIKSYECDVQLKLRIRSLFNLFQDMADEHADKMGLGYVAVSASMTNPFMWVSDKKWDGLDPETGDWPARRTASLSLQIMF